jgi:hypothetical protein
VGGRTFLLDDAEWSGPPRMFAGFLAPAGLRDLGVQPEDGRHRWTGKRPVRLRVRLVITATDGSQQTTVVPVHLSAGWG